MIEKRVSIILDQTRSTTPTPRNRILEYVAAALQCLPEFGICAKGSVPDRGDAGTPARQKMIHRILL